MSDTDTPAQPELVVCDDGDKPHAECRYCENPRPAQPEPPAPQTECMETLPLVPGETTRYHCGEPLPCATHPAPPEGTQGHE